MKRVNPRIEKKINELCGDDPVLKACLIELFRFEVLEKRSYLDDYDRIIKNHLEGVTR